MVATQVDKRVKEKPFPKLMVNDQNEVYLFPNRGFNIKLTGDNSGSINDEPTMSYYKDYSGSVTLYSR